MASLVGLGAGLHKHIFPSRPRKWRFSAFSLIETFSITKTKWLAYDEELHKEFASIKEIPSIIIIGGFNTISERTRMAKRLMLACGMSDEETSKADKNRNWAHSVAGTRRPEN